MKQEANDRIFYFRKCDRTPNFLKNAIAFRYAYTSKVDYYSKFAIVLYLLLIFFSTIG
ncbi:MAG TPA: hypothetical protein VE944_08695 [Nostoc sp.]|uniref:hypothetical protein n=1 Tax=Nostoc sp. TaxID=1180 RepID=UPI002D50A3A9|nr:hypothetical protein [Nostoc sp.]HYX14429.1 hypothetical protein [Nostoc sp.]